MKTCELNQVDRTVPLRKSINAYVCDFVITWLIACDDLPKSLKNLYQPTPSGNDAVESKSGDEPSESGENPANIVDLDTSENIEAALEIIANRKTKVEKITVLFFKFLDDILDTDTIEYFKNIKKLKELDSSSAAHSTMPSVSKDESSSMKKQEVIVTNDHEEEIVSSSKSVSTPDGSLGEGDGKHCEGKLSASLADTLRNEVDQSELKNLRNAVEKFEKERMSAPNPFIFIFMLKVFLSRQKEAEPQLVSEFEMLLERTIEERHIMED